MLKHVSVLQQELRLIIATVDISCRFMAVVHVGYWAGSLMIGGIQHTLSTNGIDISDSSMGDSVSTRRQACGGLSPWAVHGSRESVGVESEILREARGLQLIDQ